MPDHPDVLIIGGGVIGLTTAYFLARDGVRVGVIDQGDLGRRRHPAAGPAVADAAPL
jgi:glycine oxidase